MLPIAILVSGSGTNLQALLDEMAWDEDFGAKAVLVLADRPGVKALERAEWSSVPSQVVEWTGDRDSFTDAVVDAVKEAGAEALVLAGFMRILGPAAIEAFPNRIVNTHPALLPSFPGAHAIDETLAAGVKVTGVTVHFVDEGVDTGPIIAQQAVPVYPHDTADALRERIQAVEHMLLPDVVKALANDELAIDGNHVSWQ